MKLLCWNYHIIFQTSPLCPCHSRLQNQCSIRISRCSPTSTPLMRGSICRAGPAAAAPSLTWCWILDPKVLGPGRAWRPTPPLSSSSASCVRPPGTSSKWRPVTALGAATRAPSLPPLITMAVSASDNSPCPPPSIYLWHGMFWIKSPPALCRHNPSH